VVAKRWQSRYDPIVSFGAYTTQGSYHPLK